MKPRVIELAAAETHDLRRRVLREGTPSDVVEFRHDVDPATVHLGALDDVGRIVGIVTSIDAPCPHRPGAPARQLRGMAVDPAWRGRGIGRDLVAALIDRARAVDAAVVWANARDSALGFYTRAGFAVVGDGFVTTDTQLPHHVIVLDLGDTSRTAAGAPRRL
jgi:GNAT superfamily N-acetyltransferase